MTDSAEPAVAKITLHYWAAARAAAGCASEPAEGATLADVIAAAGARHGQRLADLLGICSYIVGDAPVKGADAASVTLCDGMVIEVLPPFAGGSPLGATHDTICR